MAEASLTSALNLISTGTSGLMMGIKQRNFSPLNGFSLEELLP